MTADPWNDFRSVTSARIALGRCGGSVPTRELLDFGAAHARARDAVTSPFDPSGLTARLNSAGLPTVLLLSAASSRDEYLRRPDLGRRLSDESRLLLQQSKTGSSWDLCLIVADGLSSRATSHTADVLVPLHSALIAAGWRIPPVSVVTFGRVAIQDEIGSILGATISLILLGERPGLGAPDSLGAYFVYGPQQGRTDADRNCVSNIRPDGLPPAAAVVTLLYLLNAARHRKLSGTGLKDERVLNEPTRPTNLT